MLHTRLKTALADSARVGLSEYVYQNAKNTFPTNFPKGCSTKKMISSRGSGVKQKAVSFSHVISSIIHVTLCHYYNYNYCGCGIWKMAYTHMHDAIDIPIIIASLYLALDVSVTSDTIYVKSADSNAQ